MPYEDNFIRIFTSLKKLFFILFAFYLLGLSAVPCSEDENLDEVTGTVQSAAAEHHDHDNDVCTPFCICACCATHILHSNSNNQFIITEIATIYTAPRDLKLPSAIIPIWQPPKIA